MGFAKKGSGFGKKGPRTTPVDDQLTTDVKVLDFRRDFFQCQRCLEEGVQAEHQYLDQCPFYEAPAAD